MVFTLADGVTTIVIPRRQTLAISFTEGDTLLFDINETQTIHYTITGGSDRNIIKAEMQNLDDCYTLRTTPTSTTKGTIAITATIPSMNNVIVSVSDGTQTIMAAIAVSIKPSLDENTITVETPGTLSKLLSDYDKSSITELTIIGSLNNSDIATLKSLPNLTILDMENVNIGALLSRAFYQKTSLTSVKLPKTLKTIGNSAFYGCSNLTTVTICNSLTSIGESAFHNCNLTSIIIPDNVTSIGAGAFWACSSLTTITISNNITSIEECTFYGCSSLTNVTIPDSVTSIGTSAFAECSSLTVVTIGNNVTSIGDFAFRDCSSLTTIYCKAQTPPEMTYSGFENLYHCTLYVPVGCKDAYAADYWKNAKEIIETDFSKLN